MKAMLKQRPWSALVPKRSPAMQSPDEAQSATLPSGHEVTELDACNSAIHAVLAFSIPRSNDARLPMCLSLYM
ncbi:MAG: hypothetical protein ACPIOQ_77835 [Promethearchaeia archaeon]